VLFPLIVEFSISSVYEVRCAKLTISAIMIC